MRAVVQRVQEAAVAVAGQEVSRIGPGLLVLVGVDREDRDQDACALADKIAHLRIFDDEEGRLNLSVQDKVGAVLLVSQFTLLGDCRKGRRPSYGRAAPPEQAEGLCQLLATALSRHGLPVATGVFRANMAVSLVNDGPVTLLLDSRRLF
ncbi:MAG: D-aminoacyl-tRNA deacylase [Thermodesulfobacteriota bacterium]